MKNEGENNYIQFLYDRLKTSKSIDATKELKKYQLLEEGLKLVKEDTKDDLKVCFLNYGDDAYSVCIYKTLILCLKKLENGEEIENIINLFKTIKLTPFMIREISNLLIYFSDRGVEFKKKFEHTFMLENDSNDLYFNKAYIMSEKLENITR